MVRCAEEIVRSKAAHRGLSDEPRRFRLSRPFLRALSEVEIDDEPVPEDWPDEPPESLDHDEAAVDQWLDEQARSEAAIDAGIDAHARAAHREVRKAELRNAAKRRW
jgi:hypothetical protein